MKVRGLTFGGKIFAHVVGMILARVQDPCQRECGLFIFLTEKRASRMAVKFSPRSKQKSSRVIIGCREQVASTPPDDDTLLVAGQPIPSRLA